MQKVSVKKRQSAGSQEAYEVMLEPDDKEKEDQGGYSKLQQPSEDIYAEANFDTATKTPVKQAQGATQRFRVGCLILSLVCLVLLVVVIVLIVKLGAGSTNDSAGSYIINQCTTCKSVQVPTESPNGCPTGWLRLDQSCFYLSHFRLNWQQSQTNCSGRGGSLAVVSSLKVQNFLTQKGKGLKYWIGLRHNGGTWTWVNNDVLAQSHWGNNLANGDCGMLSSGNQTENNWMRGSCRAYSYYICQRQLEQQAANYQHNE
ncbi:early activation antigen CD69-like [Entelurus aequoreus]|uniref:early activation antigen CD69-like n=1 Tax=Entelurus aequoreus TaxID=161455 RepID=UPI002B1E1D75|nr:early activation antigen CD69-like [Entelurus aequoreus]